MVKIRYLGKTLILARAFSEEDLVLDIWPLKLFFFFAFFCPPPGQDLENLTSFDFHSPS